MKGTYGTRVQLGNLKLEMEICTCSEGDFDTSTKVEICRKGHLNSNTGANPGNFSMGGRRKSKK